MENKTIKVRVRIESEGYSKIYTMSETAYEAIEWFIQEYAYDSHIERIDNVEIILLDF